ncbi:MAG: hypothetical protein IJF15_07750 [Oscillospiraceae bacterium]|nr:hypothetical protein [Oscillospiraceae bacterium]
MASTLGAAATGGIEKAFLVIHKLDAEKVNSARAAAAAQMALQAASATTGALTGAIRGAGLNAHVMQVQYNPSTLSIQANAEAIPFTYLQQNIDSGIPNQNLRPPMVVLSVELVFDAMNPQDAFMMDRTRLSVDHAVSGISKAVQGAKGGYTVQPQTEGLVAALMRPSTRLVTFRWGDMAFTGQMIEARAEYTMFSVSGKPIRSHVQMNIAQQVESDADISYWDNVLDDAFQNSNDVSLKGVSQKAGSLLNLDMF